MQSCQLLASKEKSLEMKMNYTNSANVGTQNSLQDLTQDLITNYTNLNNIDIQLFIAALLHISNIIVCFTSISLFR